MSNTPIQAQVFKYEPPEASPNKTVVQLCRSDILHGSIQVIGGGGENNLHGHTGSDGFWLVLGGRVRFYGEGDVLLADLGKYEGILIPRGFLYWFESASDEPLEILRVGGSAQNVKDERINATPLKEWQLERPHLQSDRTAV